MRDQEAPGLDTMEQGVRFIDEQTRAGRAVAVHCLAGEGRTGCVLAAYLIRVKKQGASQAITKLRSLKPGFVERNQERAVYDFEAEETPPSQGVSQASEDRRGCASDPRSAST